MLVTMDTSPQVPAEGSQVAETGLHQVRRVMTVTNEAHADSAMMKYKPYRYLRCMVMRSKAVEMLHLTGTMLIV